MRRGPSLRQQLEGPEPGAEGNTTSSIPLASIPLAEPSWKPEGQGALRCVQNRSDPQGPAQDRKGIEWAWWATCTSRLTVGFLRALPCPARLLLKPVGLTLKPAGWRCSTCVSNERIMSDRSLVKRLLPQCLLVNHLWTQDSEGVCVCVSVCVISEVWSEEEDGQVLPILKHLILFFKFFF